MRIFKYNLVLMGFCFGLYSQILAATYYVSSSGNDTSTGSLTAPFLHIQRAAMLAQPGDVVSIHEGIYRETVTPIHSGTEKNPITFQAFGDGPVIVSGADLLPPFFVHNASLGGYTIPITWNLGLGNNQVFVDGQMLMESRWPHTPSLDPTHPMKSRVKSVSCTGCGRVSQAVTVTIHDTALSQPTGFWNEALIHFLSGHQWVATTATVNSYVHDTAGGHLTFTMPWEDAESTLDEHSLYYLTGTMKAFGYPGEFETLSPLFSASQTNTDTLALNLPAGISISDPNAHAIEMKRRKYAFDFTNLSYMTVRNIHIFAATITSLNSQGLLLDGIEAKYVSHSQVIGGPGYGWWVDALKGILLNGNNNILQNSSIEYSSGSAIAIVGNKNTVTNCYVHDLGYNATETGAVYMTGDSNQITHSTFYNSGRSMIVHRNSTAAKFLNNELYNIGFQTQDLGATYTYNTDGAGTEIAFNKVHDVLDRSWNQVGIYLDNGSRNMNVHHNLIWNTNIGIQVNAGVIGTMPSFGHHIFHNTVVGRSFSLLLGFTDPINTSIVQNNIFTPGFTTRTGTTFTTNLQSSNPGFTNASAQDFSLAAGSPAIGAGTTIPPYPNDLGALPFKQIPWTSGASLPVDSSSAVPSIRDAFALIQAESFDAMHGVRLVPSADSATGAVGYTGTGNWMKYSAVDFGSGASTFVANVAAYYKGRTLLVHLDSLTGPVLVTLPISATGGWSTFKLESASLSSGVHATGVHDIYVSFAGPYAAGNYDWFKFIP